MDNNLAAQIAANINNQLRSGGGNLQKVWSWGFNAARFGVNSKNQAYLRFRVQGFKLRGVVRISLNEGTDSYVIEFFKGNCKVAYKCIQDVYCDNLTEIIDCEVETNDDQSEAYEYLVNKENFSMN